MTSLMKWFFRSSGACEPQFQILDKAKKKHLCCTFLRVLKMRNILLRQNSRSSLPLKFRRKTNLRLSSNAGGRDWAWRGNFTSRTSGKQNRGDLFICLRLLTLYTSCMSMISSKQVYRSFNKSTTCTGKARDVNVFFDKLFDWSDMPFYSWNWSVLLNISQRRCSADLFTSR